MDIVKVRGVYYRNFLEMVFERGLGREDILVPLDAF